jgi:hypothetical protein
MARPERVQDRIADISSGLGSTVGEAARSLASQASACVDADEVFPMAGCFKIPDGLPTGLLVASKTGGVSGTSDDDAIEARKGLSYRASARASQPIAGIAADVHGHLREPA